ncbi:hypothetical protein JANAI62_03480 [Jannaschia pagri]|uniref:Uncharacterized protein n=1 Tax=Jannaschia pagri TaxID=2829797 RepID=A0ABQ4NH33_9RHOB|nr:MULTISPECIES: hypothetical protein [unclassified Jannaschia]GIT90169.1 hypothetical protein JANAI61_06270 [Jannaschia sp. AI_61]GIT93725.1 hypothetical protein JANAI62_03480 [Jannaschia sp. AI_62]
MNTNQLPTAPSLLPHQTPAGRRRMKSAVADKLAAEKALMDRLTRPDLHARTMLSIADLCSATPAAPGHSQGQGQA